MPAVAIEAIMRLAPEIAGFVGNDLKAVAFRGPSLRFVQPQTIGSAENHFKPRLNVGGAPTLSKLAFCKVSACKPLLHLRQRREDAGPGADALLETPQVVLLVRRVDVVVIQSKTDQQRVQAKRALEVGDD